MEVIKQFFRDIGTAILGVFGIDVQALSFSPAYIGIIALGLALLIIVLVIVIIAKSVKKKRAKNRAIQQIATRLGVKCKR